MNKFISQLAASALAYCILVSGSAFAQSISTFGGSAQSTAINASYAVPLVVQVLDAGNSPVTGATVTFTLPASGASGTFPGSVTTAMVATDAGGIASSPAVTANGTVGAFAATATATGVATSAMFNLLNSSGATYTVVVTPTTPDWTFLAETGTGAGTFVNGPGTPPAGTGSVQVQAVSTNGGELFYTQQFAGMRLDSIKGLQFSTYIMAGANDVALNLDIDADLTAPTGAYEGRIVFSPGLIAGAVVPGIWQTWDASTQKAWWATKAPISAVCTQATPCTLAQIIAAFPNAGVIAQLFPGTLGFKLGNNGATGTVAVDKFVLVREGPPATLTGWTYDFELTAPAVATIVPTAGMAESTPINSPFATPLSAQVRDAAGQMISGVTLTFDLPASGASGTFPGSVISATAVTTSVSGQATSPIVTANSSVGAFLATASTTGPATPATFNLLNTNGAAYTIVVTPTTPDWTFATETAPGSATGAFVTGPATPPAGVGSVQLQGLINESGEFFSTPQFAGMRLNSLRGLQFSTFVSGGVYDLALGFDVDANLSSPTAVYEGRLVFDPNLVPNAVVPGIWQTWDAYTQKGWYGSRAPINATCSLAAPCTLAQVLAAYPNAGVIAQLFSGAFGFKLGNNHTTGTAAVDKLVLVREGPPATFTAWTYDFEPASPTPASVTATSGTPQSASINTAFAAPLVAQVRDAGGQLLSGVTVTFATPNSGASATFPGSAVSVNAVTTSANGAATSPVVTANATAGTYSAMATTGAATAGNFALTNTQGATGTSLGSSLNPSTFGASVTFTATVAPAAATGTVSFFDGATLLGTGTLAGGMATFSTSGLAVASHPITAVYGGDANYVGSTSAILTQTVNQATTTTSLGTAPNPSTYLQAVTLTATVVPATATGTVTFFDGATNLGSGAIAGGTASISVSTLNAHSHALTAVYGGDASYLGSSSAVVTQVVNKATTTTTVTATPNPSPFGQAVTFTATVLPATATGTVTFTDGGTVLGTAALSGGIATLTTSSALALGTHPVTAAYGGKPNYLASSGMVSLLITQAPASIVTTSGTPQSTPINMPFGAVLTATVNDAGGNAIPGISVIFSLPSSGASGTFPGAVLTANATSNASGVATSPIVTANATIGTFNATAAAAGVALPASFALTNTVGPPASIVATGGTPQSTSVTTVFAATLQATVKDSSSNPVPGVVVTFTLPTSGASGTFAGAVTTATATTNASGVAISSAITANANVGSYSASAAVTGVATAATFALQNTVPTVVTTLTVIGGNGQSTRVSTAFPTTLTVKAVDSGGIAVPNATVQFTVPSLGASATLNAASAITDSNGIASVTATASAISGGYVVGATSGTGAASFSLTNTITISVGNVCSGATATDADLVEQYYAAILRRPSDSAGKTFWMNEADRMCALGVDPKQTFLVMGEVFFNSPEYIAQNRDNSGFVTDLYITFFSRLPDSGGLNFWQGQIGAGMPRNNVMNAFLFSSEFTATMNAEFPGRTARAETYLVMNLYGGFFRRLADSDGYTYWTGQFRAAQCQANPAAAVQATINNVSNQFVTSPEYLARNTSNSQIVQDLYYAMLQRGGDLTGFNYWVGQITSNAMNRSQVRLQFLLSPEMTTQSATIAAQGCLH